MNRRGFFGKILAGAAAVASLPKLADGQSRVPIFDFQTRRVVAYADNEYLEKVDKILRGEANRFKPCSLTCASIQPLTPDMLCSMAKRDVDLADVMARARETRLVGVRPR